MGNKLTLGSKSLKSGATDADIREFLKHVRPLDLLVFRGTEVFSKTIRIAEALATGSGEISHVEMCITRELCPSIAPLRVKTSSPVDLRTLLSWGSTASGPLNDGVKSAETGKSHFGVQVRVLYDLIRNYLASPGGNVGVCRLHENPALQRPREPLDAYLARRADLVAALQRAYADYNGATYNANILALLSALFPQLRGIHGASSAITAKFFGMNKWLFCSEFVATVYIHIGVITDETDGAADGKVLDPAHVVPVDFIGFDTDSNGLTNSICDKPVWAKQNTSAKQSALERMGTVVHNIVPIANLPAGASIKLPLDKLKLEYPGLTPADSVASLGASYPQADQHGYKISPSRGLSAAAAAVLADGGDSISGSSSASSSSVSSAISDSSTAISAAGPPPLQEQMTNLTQMFDKEPAKPSAPALDAATTSPAFRPVSASAGLPERPASAVPQPPVSARKDAAAAPVSARLPAMSERLPSARKDDAGAAAAETVAALAAAQAAMDESADPIVDVAADSASDVSYRDDTMDIPVGIRPGSVRMSIVDDATAQTIDEAKPKRAGRIRHMLGRGKKGKPADA